MKRKNILKFVSLLGIGSIVMLAAASCSQAANPTQNPRSATPNDGNANPSSTETMMDPAARELSVVRASFSTLVDSESKTTELYADYAKIQKTLKEAFGVARAVVGKSDSTTQSLKDAKATLESAISNAEKEKTDFDTKNDKLVAAYTILKDALKDEKTMLDSLAANANYKAIEDNLKGLYEKAKPIVLSTLIPIEGNSPVLTSVTAVSEPLSNAITRNEMWKINADNLVNSFVKRTLVQKDLTAGTNQSNTMPQPGNYSFVGYSVDIGTDQLTTGSTSSNMNVTPNWNFAQRVVWTAPDSGATVTAIPNNAENSTPLSSVSWIYSLTGPEAKYKLSFPYFGVSNKAYLYFPYKLVNSNDQVALQYKLNDGEEKVIEFGTASEQSGTVGAERAVMSDAQTGSPQTPEEASADKAMPETTIRIATPTVGDIKIAKIQLTDLKFGINTVEFRVPTQTGDNQPSKVAPMIGNMYITSSDDEANEDKIYADLFGNSYNQETSPSTVTVDLLKGYSLAANFNTYIRQFTNLKTENPVYLVGLIGGTTPRFTTNNKTKIESLTNKQSTPSSFAETSTLSVYVNAPETGNYYISGSYISSKTQMRSLKFATTNMSSNSVTIQVQAKENFTSLDKFDTSDSNTMITPNNEMNKTLMLQKGLNKIIISGVERENTPFIGNLTFTLMNASVNQPQVKGADKEN
ncbi:FIVAR domain-containing protein [Mycoplasma tullyi]|uniref:FIVAR domain-containing protein n=1 Tax=Mycoplasma tullyi TaxID=1612150 RepID=A0A7D7U3B9_9MOLU|nr:FIVAR domain-containing protein [Mycoplasma tullyi]QMT98252.1 FIVAR domain-containing protein [Mycoplasma tullyi]